MKTENNIPKNQGFEIPRDYFVNLSERLQQQLDLDDYLGASKNTGFQVPENYFENNKRTLASSIISDSSTKKTKVISLPKIAYSILSAAAAILLLFVLKPFNKDSFTISDIDALAVESYLDDTNLENIQYDVETMLLTDNSDFLFDGLDTSNDNILDYLQRETDISNLDIH